MHRTKEQEKLETARSLHHLRMASRTLSLYVGSFEVKQTKAQRTLLHFILLTSPCLLSSVNPGLPTPSRQSSWL